MHSHIDDIEFTIFDTETTGLDPHSGDRIVEIGAIRLKNQVKKATFQALVNPKRNISEAAFQVNKITPVMLAGAPLMDMVMPKFLDFIKGTCLCSYNAAFDLEFLNNELRLIGKQALEDIVVVDILKMAKRLLPRLERYALWFVSQELGIRTKQEHRALSDVELTLDVFNKLRSILHKKGISDFNNFISLFSLNSGALEDINQQKIAKIQQALELGVKLKIRYLASSTAEVSQREVIPKKIQQDKDRFYLVGHCTLRNEERSFRIDGILHLEIL